MKDITQAVVDGTYDRPLGRGLLRWRILDLDEEIGETKHVVEVVDGVFAYLRKCEGVALLTAIDTLRETDVTLAGLPEVLDVSAVVLYSPHKDDPLAQRMGMTLSSVCSKKAGGTPVPCPDGFEVDVILNEVETKRLLKIAEESQTMRAALFSVGRGQSFFCRYPAAWGDAIMIVDRDEEGIISLNTFHVIAVQDIHHLLDGFNYLTSKEKEGRFESMMGDEEIGVPVQEYMESIGFEPYRNSYILKAAPKGE